MRFGAHAYLWTPRWSDECLGLMDSARRLGLDALELSIGDDVPFTPALTRRRAEQLGLELLVGPGGLWPMDCDISLESPDDQRRGVAWHERAIDLAGEVGASAYAGAIYGHPGRVECRMPTEAEYRRIAGHLHALAARAAARGVRLVLEPMSHFRTHLVNRPDQLVRLVELADHPNLGILLDTFHMITEVRDYPGAVRAAAGRLWGLHACESDRGVPGGGLVPWASLAAALKEIGFDGYVGLETYCSAGGLAPSRGLFHDPCPDGDAFVREGLAFLKKALQDAG